MIIPSYNTKPKKPSKRVEHVCSACVYIKNNFKSGGIEEIVRLANCADKNTAEKVHITKNTTYDCRSRQLPVEKDIFFNFLLVWVCGRNPLPLRALLETLANKKSPEIAAQDILLIRRSIK